MAHPAIVMAIQCVAGALEVIGTAVIALAFAYALGRAVARFGRPRADAYERLRVFLGRSLLLGLEFLVAADIVQTVLLDEGFGGILSLGLLVVIRILLGWSIAVEIEGCWPWQAMRRQRVEGGDQRAEGAGDR